MLEAADHVFVPAPLPRRTKHVGRRMAGFTRARHCNLCHDFESLSLAFQPRDCSSPVGLDDLLADTDTETPGVGRIQYAIDQT